MAMYSPIRDAFADLNKLIQDSQQWDERRAAANADREFQNRVLTSQLEQRQFNNEMAVNEQDLREAGEERLADDSAFRRMNANRQWERDGIKAGQDTEFHNARMDKMAVEQENLAMDMQERKQFVKDRKEWLGQATQDIFVDPISKRTEAGAAISQKIKGLENRMGKMGPNNVRNLTARAGLKQQVNQLKGELERETAGANTPEERIDTWRAQADEARKLAPQWMKQEPKTGQALMDIADDYDRRADAERDAIIDAKKASAKAKNDAKAKDSWDKRYDRFTKHYGKLDANNQIFLDPAAKGRTAIAQTYAQAMETTGQYTQGELLLQGFAAVDTVEGKLEQDLALIEQDVAEGLLSPEEYPEEKAARINKFIKKYGYDPTAQENLEVLPEDMEMDIE